MNKLYDLLKYIIYASFYMIVIKTGMDFYGYKRFPKLYESYSAPWYTEALLYIAASLFVIVVCFVLRVIIGRKMKKIAWHLFGGHAQCVHTIISAHQSNGFFIKNETWMLVLSVKVCEERNGIIFD